MITNRHVRSIIKEEILRNRRKELCTEAYIHEQSASGITSLFGNLFAPFKNFYGNIWKKISSKIEGYYDGFIKDLEAEIRKGGEEDIDFKNPKHRKLYIEAMIKPTVKSLAEAVIFLEIAKGVKDWTPSSDSKEDLQGWKNSQDGKNSNALFDAHGIFMGIADSFSEISTDLAKAEKEGQGLSSPTEAASWMVNFLETLKDIEAEASAVKADPDFSEMFSLSDQCSSLVKEIASNMKASTNESREKYAKIIRAVDLILREQESEEQAEELINEILRRKK